MSNENLPLLPDPWAQSVTSPVVNYYTAEQMQAYARAAIAIAPLEAKLRQYEQHGVTCQTFRHFVDSPCAECNTISIAEHEREKAGTPRKESASSIRLQMILQLLDDPEHDFTSADMEYWDTLHDRVQAMAREKAGAQALRETVEKIARIAHCGGLVGMSEHDALVAIRKESLQFWRTVETVEQARAALRQQGGNV